MTDRTRRTEIKIETHEITVIRFGTVHTVGPLDQAAETTDVRAYGQLPGIEVDGSVDEQDTLNGIIKEKNNESENK